MFIAQCLTILHILDELSLEVQTTVADGQTTYEKLQESNSHVTLHIE